MIIITSAMKNKSPVGQKLDTIAPTPKAIILEAMFLLFRFLILHLLIFKKITSAFAYYILCEGGIFVNYLKVLLKHSLLKL